PMASFLPTDVVSIGGVNVRYEQIIVVVLAAVAASGLGLLFRSTTTGIAMQGVVDDPDLLALQGIEPKKVRRTSWIIGASFAALSGALLAPSLGLDAALLTLL